MERKEIEEKVKEFLIEEIEVDEDSLDFVDIVVLVNNKFGFKIKQEEMVGVDTFSKFCDYIEKKIN